MFNDKEEEQMEQNQFNEKALNMAIGILGLMFILTMIFIGEHPKH